MLSIKFVKCKDTKSIPDVNGSGISNSAEQACVVPLSKACSLVTAHLFFYYMANDKKDWFRLKKYPHIGLPLKLRHRGWIEEYIFDPKNIKKHSFYPFIHRKLSVRKFRKKKNPDGSKTDKRIEAYKEREVFYANHLDSMIYSYYSQMLTVEYEKKLAELGLQDCITAYRSIPLNKSENSRNKCNIDFANDIFTYIQQNSKQNLVAITFDITAFFDNLNHLKLKKAWIEILGKENLPDDHYALFKNLTKFSYIEIDDIFNNFKQEIITDNKGKLKKTPVPRLELMKEKNAIAFCNLTDFDLKIRKKNLIKSNRFATKNDFETSNLRCKGIPQGSPISATLANIYLYRFDDFINKAISSDQGIYRRYSDDMVVIIDEIHKDKVLNLLIDKIKEFDLEIQPSKSQIFYFQNFEGKYGCKELNIFTNLLSENTVFEYLGFAFDGSSVSLKSAGLSKYYRKMKRSIRRGGFYAKNGRNQIPHLFKNRLYKKFTFIGSHRRMRIRKIPGLQDKFYRTGEYDWGNFLTYANLAERTFTNNKIKSQIRNHWSKFHQLLKVKQQDIEQHYKKKKKKK